MKRLSGILHHRQLWVILATLAVALAVVAEFAVSPTPSTSARPVVISPSTASPMLTSATASNIPAPAISVPMSLGVPALGIETHVMELGLNANGTVQVPPNTVEAGWYKYGPTPGRRGSAVILAHVDSYKGIGVFFYIKNLRAGNVINVTLRNHSVAHFKVNRVMEYSQKSFPDALVYKNHGTTVLNLVTCGGIFDHATGSYESNIVVFSTFTGFTR